MILYSVFVFVVVVVVHSFYSRQNTFLAEHEKKGSATRAARVRASERAKANQMRDFHSYLH